MRQERGRAVAKVLKLALLVVRGAGFPAGVDHTNPLECQRTHGRMMLFAGCDLQTVTRGAGALPASGRKAKPPRWLVVRPPRTRLIAVLVHIINQQ